MAISSDTVLPRLRPDLVISRQIYRGASSYVVERALDGATPLNYVTVATPTNTKVHVNTMVSGSRYWFRVAAVGAAGTGMWTLEMSKIAP